MRYCTDCGAEVPEVMMLGKKDRAFLLRIARQISPPPKGR